MPWQHFSPERSFGAFYFDAMRESMFGQPVSVQAGGLLFDAASRVHADDAGVGFCRVKILGKKEVADENDLTAAQEGDLAHAHAGIRFNRGYRDLLRGRYAGEFEVRGIDRLGVEGVSECR